MKTILPPSMLGVLGGGQLGRMFTIAAKTMGYRVLVWDPDPLAPAAAFADIHLCTPFDDKTALEQVTQQCAAITTEFENVNTDTMQALEAHMRVAPSAHAVAIAQDRITEKHTFTQAGLTPVPYLAISNEQDLNQNLSPYLPGILKTARLGYDGKGQRSIQCPKDVEEAWSQLGELPCVLEQRQTIQTEISIILVRTSTAELAFFPTAENIHKNGILDKTIVPARVSTTLTTEAQRQAKQLANYLDYQGVLAVEFFVLADNTLLVNEMAPRPHNSGHFSLTACLTDQFQQQVRSLCGLLPGKPDLLVPAAVMVNLLGDSWKENGQPPRWDVLMETPNAQLHLYGKEQARPGRKMGHYTVLSHSIDEALAQATSLKETL